MNQIGIIDLGSNSIRLVIIDIKKNGAHHEVENLKESIRLRSNTDTAGFLSQKGISSAVEMISLFVKFCRVRQVSKIIAVATATVRSAPNRNELVNKITKETGITIKVLSREEEAYLGYIGLVNSVTDSTGLMADLGGGALKMVGFKERLNQNTLTLDFGAVSLTEKYQMQGLPEDKNLAAMEVFLKKTFSQISWLPNYPKLIGIGGTFRTLASIYRHHVGYIPDITHGITIPSEIVGEIYTILQKMSLEKRKQIPGLTEDFADLSIAGIGIIYHLLQAIGSTEVMISVSSLREGLFYQHIYPRDPILFNVLTHHTNNLIDYYNLDEKHLRRVSNLAVILFDQLAPLHKFGSYERRILLIASLLHGLGIVINAENIEKHTLYTVLNSPLHGLTHRERVLVAFLAASHNEFFGIDLQSYVDCGPIKQEDIERIKKLATLLQIAHSLDRSRTGVVTTLQAEQHFKTCKLKIFSTQKCDLEIRDAYRQAKAFKEDFGLDLKIIQG